MEFIPVSEPAFIGNERDYVLDCIDSGWVSSIGKYIDQFETGLAEFFGVKHAVACSNGTVALHLALEALHIGAGDEVIVPTFSFVASANAVRYTGATPVFVDIDPDSWVIDPAAVRAAVTPKTRAIMPVHIFGHPAPMDEINRIAEEFGLSVVEDAAEAHGALYKGRKVGNLGDIACLSFFGNKIITTGEGGVVLTDNDEIAAKARLLKGQGQDPQRRYWFLEIGYNYRMTNIQAAIGLAQLEKIEWHLARRAEIAGWYRTLLREYCPSIQQQAEQPWATSAYWLNSIVLPVGFPLSRDETIAYLRENNIDSRPFFYPMHRLPAYLSDTAPALPVAEAVAARGLSLPTYASLTHDQVRYIVTTLARLTASPAHPI